MPTPTSSTPLPLFHVVGFTGHRNLANPKGVARVLKQELVRLQEDFPAQWTALSSVAEGADMIFAREAIELDIPWRALLPMPPAQFQQDFDESRWRDVETLLAEAMHVETTGDSAASTREHAYLDCGHETVNDADILFAVWDGQAAKGTGGTGEIVGYARKLGMPVLVIDPETLKVTRENFDHFEVDDAETRFLRSLVPPKNLPTEPHPCGAPESLVYFQAAADYAAMRASPRLRTLATMIVVFNSIAALVSTTDVAFALNWVALPWTESALVALALISALIFRQQMRRRSWIRCRLVAEVCRAAIATWGLPHAARLLSEIEIRDIRRLLSSLRILHQQGVATRRCPIHEYRQSYLKHRIDDQLAYYQRQRDRAVPRMKWLRAAFYGATSIGILLTFANALHATFKLTPLGPLAEAVGFVFLPIVLPAFAAASVSFISINDLQRRVARYREMVIQLQTARTQVADAQTWTSLEREANKTEHLLIQEVLEWHTISRYSDSAG